MRRMKFKLEKIKKEIWKIFSSLSKSSDIINQNLNSPSKNCELNCSSRGLILPKKQLI